MCAPQDSPPHSDDYFYTISYDEIDTYTSSGNGSSCPQLTSTGNTPPTIGSLSSSTIPSQTPFVLTASADFDPTVTILHIVEEFGFGPGADPYRRSARRPLPTLVLALEPDALPGDPGSRTPSAVMAAS